MLNGLCMFISSILEYRLWKTKKKMILSYNTKEIYNNVASAVVWLTGVVVVVVWLTGVVVFVVWVTGVLEDVVWVTGVLVDVV